MLVNAQLLAEGWNSPRATVCMHLAPTASKRIYQQRVGRVTRRHPGKEAGIVVDFVHPATKHDDPVVTLHSLLDREVYRGGAIVVGPVRRGRGRRLRVERRVLPVTADENRRIEVFERELWRIAVEHLDYGEQVQWAALAGARVAPAGWRRARAMLHFDQGGELKRTFLITAVDRNKNAQLRLRALQEIAASRDAEAFDRALDFVESWPREDKREGVKSVLQALAEKKVGRRDQANNWIWRCANMTREVHEEYAVQRWPETKRLLGLLVNSSGAAHARNARRLVHAARQQDRRLSAALLAAAIPHTAEAGEVINGARTRMSRKPAALARELLRNFPKGGKGRRGSRRRKKKGAEGVAPEVVLEAAVAPGLLEDGEAVEAVEVPERKPVTESDSPLMAAAAAVQAAATAGDEEAPKRPRRRSVKIDPDEDAKPARRRRAKKAPAETPAADAPDGGAEAAPPPRDEGRRRDRRADRRRPRDRRGAEAGPPPPRDEGRCRRRARDDRRRRRRDADADADAAARRGAEAAPPPRDEAGRRDAPRRARRRRRPRPTRRRSRAAGARRRPAAETPEPTPPMPPRPTRRRSRRRRRRTTKAAPDDAPAGNGDAPKPRRRSTKAASTSAAADRASRRGAVTAAVEAANGDAPAARVRRARQGRRPEPTASRRRAVRAAEEVIADGEPPKPRPRRRTAKAPEAA